MRLCRPDAADRVVADAVIARRSKSPLIVGAPSESGADAAITKRVLRGRGHW
jgi:hypothetical protein